MTTRTNKVTIIVGGRNQGKTDFVKNLLYPNRSNRIIIGDTFDNPPWRNWKTHDHPEREAETLPIVSAENFLSNSDPVIRLADSDTNAIFDHIQFNVMNASVVLEDATRFIDSNVPDSVKNFVLDTKQKNIDLFFVFHSLSDVPPKLVRWSDYLTLFKTNENFNSYLRQKFPNQAIEAAFNRVKSLPQYSNITINIGG